MRDGFARGIACVVACVNFLGFAPAQDYETGKIAGMARLERELDRASLERDKGSWKAISSGGISLAMAEWEMRTIALRDSDPAGWLTERVRTAGEFEAISMDEYAEWLSDSFFGKRGIVRDRRLADDLARRAAEWKYEDKNGLNGRIIAPEAATDARSQWRTTASAPVIDEYLSAWERDNVAVSAELREALFAAGSSPREIEVTVAAGIAKASALAREEYARVAEIEENRLIASLLYDSHSLRNESEERAAAAIADRISEATRAETGSEMSRVLESLETSFDGGDRTGIEIDPDSWMSSFRASMDSAMAKWESAESEFLVRRAEWERDAQQVYLDGEQSWADAFASLRDERERWQEDMLELFNEGAARWEDRERSLADMLRNAREEFQTVTAEESRKTSDLIDLEISIYDQSRSMMDMSVQAIEGWHEEWGDRYAEVYSFWKTGVMDLCPSGPLVKPESGPSDGDTGRRRARVSEWKIAARDMLCRQLGMELERKRALIAALGASILKCQADQESVLSQRNRLDGRYSGYKEAYAELTLQLAGLSDLERAQLNGKMTLEGQVEKIPEYAKALMEIDCAKATGAEIDVLVVRIRDELTIDAQNLSEIGGAWDAADSLISWSEMIDAYRKKADGATQRLLEIAGSVAGQSTGKTYYSELHMESLKAKAIAKRYSEELAVAEAVDEYASNWSASAEWATETVSKLSHARLAYEAAVDGYDAEVAKLDSLLIDSNLKAAAIEAARAELSRANDAVRLARDALSDATLALKGIGLDALREKAASLAAELRDSWADCEAGTSGEAATALAYYRYARENAQASADAIVCRLVAGLINGSDGQSRSNPGLSEMRGNESRASELSLADPGSQYAAIGEIPDEYASLRGIISGQYAILSSESSSAAERNVARSILSDSWKAVSSYWNERIREREACIAYLRTGKTGYEGVDPESQTARQERVERWLKAQDRLIADELSIIASRAETDDTIARSAILRGLAMNIRNVLGKSTEAERAREIDLLREASPAFASLIRMESTFENVCPEWSSYVYRLYAAGDAARRSQAHNTAIRLYSSYSLAAMNASHQTSLDAINSLIADTDVGSLRDEESLLDYITRLETEGDGLSSAAQEALANYIQGVVEYAVTRWVNDGETDDFGVKESIAARERTHDVAAKETFGFTSEVGNLRDLPTAITIAESQTFAIHATVSEKKDLGKYIGGLLIDTVSREDLEACVDKDSLIAMMSSRIGQSLDGSIIDGIWESVVGSFGNGMSSVPDSEILSEWFRLGKDDPSRVSQKYRDDPRIRAFLEAPPGDKRFQSYASGGADMLLFYVLALCPSDELSEALTELEAESPSHAKLGREYRNAVEAAKSYSVLVDGPFDEWLSRRKGFDGKPLTDAERKRAAKSIESGLVDLDSPFHVWLLRDELKPRTITDQDSGGGRLFSMIEEYRENALEGLARIRDLLSRKERATYWSTRLAAQMAQAMALDSVCLMRESGIGDDDESRANQVLRIVKARMDTHSSYLASNECVNDSLSYESLAEPGDTEARVADARSLARDAWSRYASFKNGEMGMRQALRQCLERVKAFSGSENEIKERLRDAESNVIDARRQYESAVTAINTANLAAQNAFAAYNGQVDLINAQCEATEMKKLDLQKAQAIHDWATSVYLADLAPSVDPSYETPREIRNRARYAAKRAEIASKVLEDLEREGVTAGELELSLDPSYSSAFDDYEVSTRRYYLSRAVRYEAELRLESIRQQVREAESEERAALQRLAIDDVTLDPADWSAIDFVDLSREPSTGVYSVGFDVENSNPADRDLIAAYFNEKTEEIKNVDGKTYQSRGKQEAIDWLVVVERRSDSEKYLADLGLALLHAKAVAAERDGDYECLFGDGSGSEIPPIVVDGLWSEPFAATMHGEDLAAIYRQGRITAIKEAYESVMGDAQAISDLARYALYRDTILSQLRFAQSEKAHLETRAMSYVRSKLDVIIQSAVNDGIFYASEAAVMSIPAVFCPWLWIGVGALSALSVTNFDKANSLSGVRSDVERNQSGKSAYANAIRDDWDGDFAQWREKKDRLAVLRDSLSACVASVATTEAGGLTYAKFSASVGSLLGNGTMAVTPEDAKFVYSEKAFAASGAEGATSAYEARALIDAYYLRDMERKQASLASVAEALISSQNKGIAEFSLLRSAAMDIPSDTKARLHQLARSSCDGDQSPETRAKARSDFEALSRELEADALLGEYERTMKTLARKSFGPWSWLNRNHDNRINALNHRLATSNAFYGRQTESYIKESLISLRDSIKQSLANSQSARLGVMENEWEIARLSLSANREAWDRQYSLILKSSDAEWNDADSRIAGEYDNWRKSVKKEYDDKVKEWTSGYDGFLCGMRDWVDEQYVYAANAMSSPLLADSGASVEVAIAAATRTTLNRAKLAGNGGFDSSKYVDTILKDAKLSCLMDYAASLTEGANSRAGTLRKYSPRSLMSESATSDAVLAVEELSKDMRGASAVLASRQAKALMRSVRESYVTRLDGENAAMRDWERDLALNAGYSIGAEISRSAIVDATALNNVRERQTLHKYADFTPGEPTFSMGFDGAGLENLGGNAIIIALERAQAELKAYGESIFGKTNETGATKRWQIPRTLQDASEKEYASIETDSTTTKLISEIRSLSERDYESLSESEREEYTNKLNSIVSVRDGAFGRHVGFAPLFNSGGELDLAKSRTENIKFDGMGELGKILLDFQWNSLMEGKGYAELSRPVYDKRLWDDRGMSFKAPTARGVVDLAMNVVSMACGNNQLLGLIDDGLFAMIDYAGGYKTVDQLATELGTKVVGTAVSFGVGWGGSQLTALATGLTDFGKTAVGAGVAGLSSAATTVSTEFMRSIDFSRLGTSEWFDAEGFTARMSDARTWASAVGSAVGAGISDGLSLCAGAANSKFFGGAIDLAGGIGGEAARFGVYAATALARGETLADAYDDMGGLTLNLLDFGGVVDMFGTAIANGNSTGQTHLSTIAGRTRGAGLLELHIGTNGMYAQLGSNGINVAGSLYRLTKGVSDMTILNNYVAEHADDGKGDAAFNAYVYGDWSSETTSRRIALGKDELVLLTDVDSGSVAKTTNNGTGRHIAIVDSGNSLNNAVALQHEAHRDGLVSADNAAETSESVIAHARMASEMKKRGLAIELDGLLALEVALYDKGDFKNLSALAANNYDSSADYWKLTSNGNFAYDGKSNVYDENGILIRETQSKGIEGSMLEILGLADNEANRSAVVSMMRSSGLEQDTKGNWNGTNVSVGRQIPYSGTTASYLAKNVNLTAGNMGKEVSLYSVDSLFTTLGVGKDTYQKFIEKNFISALGYNSRVGLQENQRWANHIYNNAYSADERSRIEANTSLLQTITNQGIDYSKVVPGATRTTAFGEEVNVSLTTSSVPGAASFYEKHPGVDYGSGGTGVYTPGGFWEVLKTEDHKLILRLYGTDTKMRIMHLDPTKVDNLTLGMIIGSANGNAKIIDYPTASYGSGSGAHTHVDFTRSFAGSNSYYRSFVNPSNWENGPQLEYQYIYYGANESPLAGYPKNFYRY